jgi:hypothetical protein
MMSRMPTVPGYDGDPVELRYSAGSGVPYVVNWEHNALKPPFGVPWPLAVIKQVNGYIAPRNWFAAADADVLAARLGRISKFQSLNSEDAVTWSWFGTLALADGSQRRAVTEWLYNRVGIEDSPSDDVRVEQWMRIVHPNALESRNGPELDARVQDSSAALIYVEAKWDAALGTGKGSAEGTKDDQVVLRRDSLRADPSLAGDQRQFAVLGVSNAVPVLTSYAEDLQPERKRVGIAWLTWDDLASCGRHPRTEEFRRYLEWKRDLIQASGR